MTEETYRLPKQAPFHNEGNTVAGWTLTWGVSLGVLLTGIGLIVSPIMMGIGIAVIVISIAASFILSKAGYGQPRSLTNTAKGGAWYDN